MFSDVYICSNLLERKKVLIMFKHPHIDNLTDTDRWITWAIVALGSFSATLDSSIVNVALPIISKEFVTALDIMQWVVTAYLLGTCATLPIFGWLGDRMQIAHVTALGFLLRTIGSWLCAVSPNITVLISARILASIGAAMLMALAFGTVVKVFPPYQRARSLGMLGSSVGLGSISGASLGGFLISAFSWHAIFYVSVPIGIIGMFFSWWKIPRTEKHVGSKTVDILGIFLFALFIVTLVLGISSLSKPQPNYMLVVGNLLLSALSMFIFIRHERKHPQPLIDMEIYTYSAFTNGNIAGFTSFIAMFTIAILMPYYLYNILGLDPKTIGMILTLWPIGMLIAAPLGGYLADKTGKPLYFSLLGIFLIFTALILTIVSAHLRSVWIVCIANAINGFGNGLFQAPNNASTMSAIPDKFHGSAGSLAALVRNMGMIIGTSLSVTIAEFAKKYYFATYGPDSTAAFIFGFEMSAATGILASVVCIYYTWKKKEVLNA